MKIWTFHCYGTLSEHGQMTRHFNFGKRLAALGHEPVVFVGSHPHNSDIQLIQGKEKYIVYQDKPFPWVVVRTNTYKNSKIKRLIAMAEYYFNAQKAAKHFGKPDVVIGSSNYPIVAYLGIRLARKYKAKAIVEIRDLWPESLVTYGIASGKSIIVHLMRRFEKYLYIHADQIIFTMEGAYDYIVDQGWEKDIPPSKVHFINNGVDLEVFDDNREHYTFEDSDLDDSSTYKVVYTGSLRKSNDQIYTLFDVIAEMQGKDYEDYRFFIYGKGELLPELEDICRKNNYQNVRLKGYVEKKYVPYILSKCNMNILNCKANEILKYGGSQNKLFEYLASGHPTISGESSRYSVIRSAGCGISEEFASPKDVALAIRQLRERGIPYEHIRAAAEKFDYKVLTEQLLDTIEGE